MRSSIAIVIISSLVFINFLNVSLNQYTEGNLDSAITGVAPRFQKKLADGCYHVFLDVGSNIGMHVRFLFEPAKYPKARVARDFFVEQFGPEAARDRRDFCAFSFEPNPSHAARHAEMERAYAAVGWRYVPIHGGVGDEEGNMTFYHVGDDLGFTTLRSRCRQECRPEHVRVYRLSNWIEREVRGREIPQHAYGEWAKLSEPRVVMKMDIEHMEWLVFPDLLLSGILCRDISAMMGEFHSAQSYWWNFPITFNDRGRGGGGNWTIHSYKYANDMKEEWLGIAGRNPNCKTQFIMQDDESHGQDGMPWPEQSSEEKILGTV